MLLNFYRSNQPLILISIPLVITILWIKAFINPVVITYDDFSPLYSLIEPHITINQYLCVIVSVILVAIGAILLNVILNRFDFYERENYLPALFYGLILSFEVNAQTLSPVLISNILIILTLSRILKIKRQEPAREHSFNAGILMSLAFLFYSPVVFMFPFIWVSLSVLRPFIWREWILGLMGFLLPILFFLTINYIIEWKTNLYEIPFWGEHSNINFVLPKMLGKTLDVFCVILLLISMLWLSKSFVRNSIRFKKQIYIVFFLFAFTGASYIIIYYTKFDLFGIGYFAIPLSIILPYYFYSATKKWLSDSLYYIGLGLLIVKIFFY